MSRPAPAADAVAASPRGRARPRPFGPVARAMTAGLALALLGACTQVGDFGRPRAGAWNGLVDTTGSFATRERGRFVLDAVLTDDEQALRDRAWRFLVPTGARAAFIDRLAQLAGAHAAPPDWRPDDPGGYYAALTDEPSRSPVSRYRTLGEDASADARLIPALAALAARVNEADAARLRSLPFARTLDDGDVRQAASRVAENRCLIAWVRLESGLRLERYRFALEHLFAEAPGPDAVAAERALAMLSARRRLLDPLMPTGAAARCGLESVPEPAAAAGPLVAKD